MEIDVNREGEGQFAKDVVCENFSSNLIALHTNHLYFLYRFQEEVNALTLDATDVLYKLN